MNLGLLLNVNNELPTPIIDLINKLGIRVYNVSNLFESVDYSTNQLLFSSLAKIESLLSKNKIEYTRCHADFANNETRDDIDMILCWGTEPNRSSNYNTRILSLYLNDERIEQTYSGLKETLYDDSFELSVRCQCKEYSVVLASMRCKAYHSLAKTRANALNNMCILLKKVIRGEVDEQEKIIMPTPKQVIKESSLLLNIIYKAAGSRISQKFAPRSSWNIHVGKSTDIIQLGQVGEIIELIQNDQKSYYADPFVFNYLGINYIFFEEYFYKNKKGSISVLKHELDGTYSYLGVVLDLEYHLSYPFIFEINGSVYMIPETGSNKRIDLYKCIEFPFRWDFCRTLLQGFKFVDTTVFHYKEKFWLFTSALKDGVNPDSQLSLFYADNIITEDLIEHPSNPIAYGVNHSRMAGNIFLWQGGIVRPAQDCSKLYGGGISFMLIEELSENSYSERQIDKLLPFADYKGTHTFNHNNDIFVVDTYG